MSRDTGRVLRVAWFLFLYLALEAVGLAVLFALWVVSGFGWRLRSPRFEELHYQFLAWWLRRLMGSARRTFRLSIETAPGGALAAIDAAPGADVIFIGHVGLEKLDTLGDVWRGIPMDTVVTATSWVVEAGAIPEAAEREAWLYDSWEQLDDWIGRQFADTD